MTDPNPPTCKYLPNGDVFMCEFCGDRTRHARLKRICPTKRAMPATGVGAVGRYMASSAKWAASGFATRDDAAVASIIAICRQCDEYTPRSDEAGICRQCACWISKTGGLTNKIRRATEDCPIGKW